MSNSSIYAPINESSDDMTTTDDMNTSEDMEISDESEDKFNNEYYRNYYHEHKGKWKTYYLKNKEIHNLYMRGWCDSNPDYHKEYYETNRSKLLEYHKKYYNDNKERLSHRRHFCECCQCVVVNKSSHKKTKKHIRNSNMQ